MASELARFIDVAVLEDGSVITPRGGTTVGECSVVLRDVEITGRASPKMNVAVSVLTEDFVHTAVSSTPVASSSTANIPTPEGVTFALWVVQWGLAVRQHNGRKRGPVGWTTLSEAARQYGALLNDGLLQRVTDRFSESHTKYALIAVRVAQRYARELNPMLGSAVLAEADLLSRIGVPQELIDLRFELAEVGDRDVGREMFLADLL